MSPVKIGPWREMAPDDFETLRYTQPNPKYSYNPRMLELLGIIAEGTPIRIDLEPGQTHRTLRSAISNSARSRGMKVETLAGDGYVAVRYVGPQPPRLQQKKGGA